LAHHLLKNAGASAALSVRKLPSTGKNVLFRSHGNSFASTHRAPTTEYCCSCCDNRLSPEKSSAGRRSASELTLLRRRRFFVVSRFSKIFCPVFDQDRAIRPAGTLRTGGANRSESRVGGTVVSLCITATAINHFGRAGPTTAIEMHFLAEMIGGSEYLHSGRTRPCDNR